MKCLICKYLNTRDEARKHLNKQTVAILGKAYTELAVPIRYVRTSIINCDVHAVTAIAAKHLINASDFSDELRALVGLFP